MKIDKNIPIPFKKNNQLGKYDILREMEIGDSVAFPDGERYKVHPTLTRIANIFGTKFTTRRIEENGINVLRVWRIK